MISVRVNVNSYMGSHLPGGKSYVVNVVRYREFNGDFPSYFILEQGASASAYFVSLR